MFCIKPVLSHLQGWAIDFVCWPVMEPCLHCFFCPFLLACIDFSKEMSMNFTAFISSLYLEANQIKMLAIPGPSHCPFNNYNACMHVLHFSAYSFQKLGKNENYTTLSDCVALTSSLPLHFSLFITQKIHRWPLETRLVKFLC